MAPVPRTSLSVTAGRPSPVLTGAAIDYAFSVANTGTVPATGPRLTVDLPTAGGFLSSTPPSTPADGRSSFDLGTLAPGVTANVTARWTAPDAATTLHISAHASAANADPADSTTLDTLVQWPSY